MKEQELECLTLIKLHPEIFTYDKQNDVYHSDICHMSIGNAKSLRLYVEKFCKSNDRDKSDFGKLFDSYNSKDILSVNYSETNKNRFLVVPIAVAFSGKMINEDWLKEQERILHGQLRRDDKYISSSIEAQYDNYQSSGENIREYQFKSAIEKADRDFERE